MSKRAALVLLLVLSVSALALYYARWGSRAAQRGNIPELVSLVPPDTAYLFYLDLARLRTSSFLVHLAAVAPSPQEDPEYARFVRATGFDYTRDLDRVVFAVRPDPSASLNVALAEGRFDRERISNYALGSGQRERHGDAEVFLLPPRPPSKKPVALAFLGPNRVALADGPDARGVLERLLAGREPGPSQPAMRERISRLADSPAFAVGQVGQLPENFAPGGLRSDEFSNLVRSLRWFTLAARPEGDRLKVLLEGECATQENARQLAGTLDGLRVLGQAALADPKTRQRLEPETTRLLEAMLRGIEVSRNDLRVRLNIELTEQMLDRLPPAPTRKSSPVTTPKR
ncbi:MAG TPA: hypothetical protein VKE24_07000 [Candidatus Acidoferrales bacterium]|nr:hypothetical protein [Candidatus Acidoferrales bacterium]